MVNTIKEILAHAKMRKKFKSQENKYVNKSREGDEVVLINKDTLTKGGKTFLVIFLTSLQFIGLSFGFYMEKSPLYYFLLAGVLLVDFFVVKYMYNKYSGILVSIVIGVMLPLIVFGTGIANQNKIGDKPLLVNSQSDKSFMLANELLSDLLTMEDNEKLLSLPYPQARGISQLYIEAANQSAYISKKWNPVTNQNPPLPGFILVFQKVNRAADIQAHNLNLYYNLLQQSDSKTEALIKSYDAEYTTLIYGDDGAVKLLVKTVKPIGIDLKVNNG